jgi:hypothetical protein
MVGFAEPAVVVGMRIPFALAFLFIAATAFGATAPDSIAGKVYREWSLIVRSTSERTIVFGADGRFVYLKRASGGVLNLASGGKVFLNAPRADGTYVYRRTDAASAAVDLHYDDGTTETLDLRFTEENGSSGGSIVWGISDLSGATFAPAASNVSMRAQVTSGRPLIVGFVIPGTPNNSSGFTPPFDSHQRELLIRVVGPSLTAFGLTSVWADPDFQLYRGSALANPNQIIYHDWGVLPGSALSISPTPDQPDANTEAAFRKIFNSPLVGAFPLMAGSKDAAAIVRLPPGAYTIVCNAAPGDAGGEALVEVYFLP